MNKIKISKKDFIAVAKTSISASQAAKTLGIKYDTYKKYALMYNCFYTNQGSKGVARMTRHGAKHYFNDNYFDSIDSYEKAYISGFVAADGIVNNKGLRINLKREDKEILINICNALEYDICHIKDYKAYYKDSNQKIHYFDACRVCFSSKILVKALIRWNIIPNKSNINIDLFDKIPDIYKNAWLAGYIDGDGYISNTSYCVGLTGNEKTIFHISQYLKKTYNIKYSLRKIGDIAYSLNITNKNNVLKILNIYAFSCHFHLTRKYNSCMNILMSYAQNIPVSKTHKKFCIDCNRPISNVSTRCKSCAAKIRNKNNNRPERHLLKKLLKEENFSSIGKLYKVSDNAVRKWCKFYSLPYRAKDIKSISDEIWEHI